MRKISAITALAATAALAFALSAQAETIAYWPFGEHGFTDVTGNGHKLVGVGVVESDAAYYHNAAPNPASAYLENFLRTNSLVEVDGEYVESDDGWQVVAENAKLAAVTNATAYFGGTHFKYSVHRGDATFRAFTLAADGMSATGEFRRKGGYQDTASLIMCVRVKFRQNGDNVEMCATRALYYGSTSDTYFLSDNPLPVSGYQNVANANGVDGYGVGKITLYFGRTYLQTETELDLSGEDQVTFECWWRSYGTNDVTHPVLMASENPLSAGGFVVYNNMGTRMNGVTRADGNGSWCQTDSSASFVNGGDDGMWHHIAYVIDKTAAGADQCRIYYDGAEGSNNGSTTVPTLFNDYFMLGGGANYANDSGKTNTWLGCIDDVRISRGALTPDEFLKYPTVGKAMRADDGKIPVVAYWPFGCEGNVDATGNGFDLTMDDTVPMANGIPTLTVDNKSSFTNFYLASFPFSAFSKVGLTVECNVRTGTGSAVGGVGNILTLTDEYYNNQGAFRLSYEALANTYSGRIGVHYLAKKAAAEADKKYAESQTTEETFGKLNDWTWRHIAYVYDPTKTGEGIVQLYVDGVPADSNSVHDVNQKAFALMDGKLYFSRAGENIHPFYGQFKDVRITAGVLAPDQFQPGEHSTIAYWPFGENGFTDVTGNGHDLEGINIDESDASYVVFNKNNEDNQYLKTVASLDLSKEAQVTFECWCRSLHPASYSGRTPILMSAQQSGNLGGVIIFDQGQSVAHYTYGGTPEAPARWIDGGPLKAFNDGMWHHVAYTIDRTKTSGRDLLNLYVDGEPQTNKANMNVTSALPPLFNDIFVIGGGAVYNQTDGKNTWRGYIDDVRISRGVLTSDEFLKYPTVGKKMRADRSALPVVAYWPFGSKKGADTTGNGFDLVMDENVPMLNGTPSIYSGDQGKFTYFCHTNFPFSTLCKVGFTFECFARSDGLGSAAGNIFTLVPEGKTSYWGTTGAFRFGHSASGIQQVSVKATSNPDKGAFSEMTTSSINATWQHLAFVYNPAVTGAGIVKLYVDGEEADSCTVSSGAESITSIPFIDGYLLFARNNVNGSGSNPFYGQFDDVRLTAGVLAPEQFMTRRLDGETIAYWPFGEDGLNDASGNGNTLAATNIDLDGARYLMLNDGRADQYLTTTAKLDLVSEQKVTFECWWRSLECSDGNTGLLMASQNPLEGTGGIVVYNYYNDNQMHAQYRAKEADVTVNNPWQIEASAAHEDRFVDGKWHHIAYVVDTTVGTSDSCLMYIDGVLQPGKSGNPVIPALFNDFFVIGGGADYSSGDNVWHGYIDDVRITRGALTPAEFMKFRSGAGMLLLFK